MKLCSPRAPFSSTGRHSHRRGGTSSSKPNRRRPADLHVFIERGHNDECTYYGSNFEACTFVVNQDQTFEVGFQMKVNYV
jgi:hypothetical protein